MSLHNGTCDVHSQFNQLIVHHWHDHSMITAQSRWSLWHMCMPCSNKGCRLDSRPISHIRLDLCTCAPCACFFGAWRLACKKVVVGLKLQGHCGTLPFPHGARFTFQLRAGPCLARPHTTCASFIGTHARERQCMVRIAWRTQSRCCACALAVMPPNASAWQRLRMEVNGAHGPQQI